MGPQHPSTHGVLRIVLELSGETVVNADTTVGYLHTGIEKTAEQKKWQQVIPLVERMDYLSAQSNSMTFSMTVEKLLGIEVPERVRWIRVLIAELQRINSHLVWLGTHGMEVGAISVMLYCFRERELLLNLNEMLAGFRLFPSYMRIGGLREDIPRGFLDAVKQFLDRLVVKMSEYEDLLTKNEIYIERTRGVGVVSREDAIASRSFAVPNSTYSSCGLIWRRLRSWCNSVAERRNSSTSSRRCGSSCVGLFISPSVGAAGSVRDEQRPVRTTLPGAA
jgi:NADH-quinone oxidoreductase subunit D